MIPFRKMLIAVMALLTIVATAAPSLARGSAGRGNATTPGAGVSRSTTPMPFTYTSPTYDYAPPAYTYTPPGAVAPVSAQ